MFALSATFPALWLFTLVKALTVNGEAQSWPTRIFFEGGYLHLYLRGHFIVYHPILLGLLVWCALTFFFSLRLLRKVPANEPADAEARAA